MHKDVSGTPDQRAYRLTSIDMLRGLIIVIMALDHVRDFNMAGAIQDPMRDPNIGALLLFTRWSTNFCAPVFIFLAGARPKEVGLELGGVYRVWIVVVVSIYSFCRWVASVKARRSSWWLSYL